MDPVVLLERAVPAEARLPTLNLSSMYLSLPSLLQHSFHRSQSGLTDILERLQYVE